MRDLPKGQGIRRVRNVQGPIIVLPAGEAAVDRASLAGALAADENRVPTAVEIDVGDGRRTVHEDSMPVVAARRVVLGLPRAGQIGEKVVRDEAPELYAGRDVEAMEHAVVGPDIQDLGSGRVVRLECIVSRPHQGRVL